MIATSHPSLKRLMCWLTFQSIIAKYGIPIRKMSVVVSSFVEVCMYKIAMLISIIIDDWTAEVTIIASNASY